MLPLTILTSDILNTEVLVIWHKLGITDILKFKSFVINCYQLHFLAVVIIVKRWATSYCNIFLPTMTSLTQALNDGNNFWRKSNTEFAIAQISIDRRHGFRMTMLKVIQVAPTHTHKFWQSNCYYRLKLDSNFKLRPLPWCHTSVTSSDRVSEFRHYVWLKKLVSHGRKVMQKMWRHV